MHTEHFPPARTNTISSIGYRSSGRSDLIRLTKGLHPAQLNALAGRLERTASAPPFQERPRGTTRPWEEGFSSSLSSEGGAVWKFGRHTRKAMQHTQNIGISECLPFLDHQHSELLIKWFIHSPPQEYTCCTYNNRSSPAISRLCRQQQQQQRVACNSDRDIAPVGPSEAAGDAVGLR